MKLLQWAIKTKWATLYNKSLLIQKHNTIQINEKKEYYILIFGKIRIKKDNKRNEMKLLKQKRICNLEKKNKKNASS